MPQHGHPGLHAGPFADKPPYYLTDTPKAGDDDFIPCSSEDLVFPRRMGTLRYDDDAEISPGFSARLNLLTHSTQVKWDFRDQDHIRAAG